MSGLRYLQAADYVFAYDYLGGEFTLDLKPYTGKKLSAWWFDPADGVYSYLGGLHRKRAGMRQAG